MSGKLFAGHLARAVDGRTGLVHHDHRRTEIEVPDEGLSFASRRAMADSDRLRRKPHNEIPNDPFGFLAPALPLGWKNGGVVQEHSPGVQRYDLAAGPEAWVDGEHRFVPKGRRHQELAEVGDEDRDGIVVGSGLRVITLLPLEAG